MRGIMLNNFPKLPRNDFFIQPSALKRLAFYTVLYTYACCQNKVNYAFRRN